MVARGILAGSMVLALAGAASAQEKPGNDRSLPLPREVFEESLKPQNVSTTMEILLLLTVLALAPSILVMMTSFTRIVIVLSFVRRALAINELPPNQVIIGLALILTFMVMMPTVEGIRRDALEPYAADPPRLTQQEAFGAALGHLRSFMFRQTRVEDLHLFLEKTSQPTGNDGVWQPEEVPTLVLMPAFVLSELRRAFIMGFALFLPFLIIDMVVASTLISMGMLVLPPILISLPFKILLFVLVDGWHLVIGSLVESFA